MEPDKGTGTDGLVPTVPSQSARRPCSPGSKDGVPTMTRKLSFTYAAPLVVATLIMVASWLLPALMWPPSATEVVLSESFTFHQAADIHGDATHTWLHELTLPEGRQGHVQASLPLDMELTEGSPRPQMTLDVGIFVNGEEAYRGSITASTGRIVSPHGISGSKPIAQDAFVAGANRILVTAHVNITRTGGGEAVVKLGPPVIRVEESDADGDGVVDSRQWFSVHSGVGGSLLAVAAALPAYVVLKRRAAAREEP